MEWNRVERVGEAEEGWHVLNTDFQALGGYSRLKLMTAVMTSPTVMEEGGIPGSIPP